MSVANNLSKSDAVPLAAVVCGLLAPLCCESRRRGSYRQCCARLPRRSKWGVVRGADADPNSTDTARLYELRSSVLKGRKLIQLGGLKNNQRSTRLSVVSDNGSCLFRVGA